MTVPGSKQSLSFISSLLDAQDEIFDTKIRYIIEEKWEHCVGDLMQQSLIYLGYIIMISSHISVLSDSLGLVYAIFAFQILYFLFSEVPDMIDDFVEYFKDITNYFDMITMFCISYYCIQFIRQADQENKEIVYFPLYIGVLVGYWRCLNFIQVFS